MLNNNNGISLIQVMISAALLGFLSIIFMKLVGNMEQSQSHAMSKADEVELQRSIRMILDDERFCRVSLAGNGPNGSPTNPVTFKKKDIDNLDDEGLDLSLYLSDQAGDTRTLKKFNGANNPGANPNQNMSKFGKLTIKSIKLVMNNPTGNGVNYPNNPLHSDIGVIRVIIEKKISATQTRQTRMDFDLSVTMSTGQAPEGNRETRVLSCQTAQPPPPALDVKIEQGRVAQVCLSGGIHSFNVTLTEPFANPPRIHITPHWARFSGDEDTTWWVTNVTTTGFRVNFYGPNSGSCHGESFVSWLAIEKN